MHGVPPDCANKIVFSAVKRMVDSETCNYEPLARLILPLIWNYKCVSNRIEHLTVNVSLGYFMQLARGEVYPCQR